ncbi:MAG: flavodoxin [Propionibacteriaceae bacterium]|jgi:menaquinone-dependent protoporphyrinogen oxidase|nr:flavodoxin [Propionibacteriaceae bacterium]
MKKVLVAYATRMGSTGEIAEAIGEQIRSRGFEVDVQPCHDAHDAWTYDAVIVGSAVYVGHWDKDAVDYLKHQAPDLAERPTWLFQSGPCGEGSEHEQTDVPRAIRKLDFEIGLEPPMTFGGRLDHSKAVGPVSRWMSHGSFAGDFRDWPTIRAWADQIADKLLLNPTSTTVTSPAATLSQPASARKAHA